ncbi:MAG: hypothetical protein IPP74_00650 [Alphaproteobacteria bacterium]|nr:hypothetical protein [Alphaproteobacteria bacterium]
MKSVLQAGEHMAELSNKVAGQYSSSPGSDSVQSAQVNHKEILGSHTAALQARNTAQKESIRKEGR